jgi:predicted  nucleic acid-binding Zn-ribbon protein
MTIPILTQGAIYVDDVEDSRSCHIFVLDAPEGSAWLESATSFRFQPRNGGKPYTVRKESGIYWYGCRKIAGKVRKKYIGKSSEVTMDKLEKIAEALEVPPVPRANKVAEVAQKVTQDAQVAEKVAEVAQDRLTALELEVANLRKALEALQEALPGKSEAGDSKELPKVVDNEVAEELQNELGNLKAENEYLCKKLAESRDTVETLNWGTESLNEQLEAGRVENQRLQNDLSNSQAEVTELRSQLEAEQTRYEELDEEFRELDDQWSDCKKEVRQLEAELADLKQKSAAASKDLPEAADLLNQLKSKRKKSTTTLADVEKILKILEGNV